MNADFFDENFLKKHNISGYGYTEISKPLSLKIYKNWLLEKKEGILGYLSDERSTKRESLNNVFPEFKSSLVFLFSYASSKKKLNDFYESKESNGLKIGSYVLGFGGEDYHDSLKRTLIDIGESLKEKDPNLEYGLCLDIHPVLERDLAYRSGLGFFGKNSMLINRKHGSFNIIGSLLLSKKLDLDIRKVETDHCGNCTVCIDSCPTLAIDPKSRTIESNKCISTFTIELFKDSMEPPKGFIRGESEIFGCDICQDVCPWNKKPLMNADYENRESEKEIQIKNFFLKPKLTDIIKNLESLSNRKYQKLFFGTPLFRTGRVGMLKNLKKLD